jgi:hypothetical protein
MIYTNGRYLSGTNTANTKAIFTTLILGTSMLAANANLDIDNHDANGRPDNLGWDHHEAPPSGDNDPHWAHGHDTYAAVPESTAMIAASLLLLPLGVGVIRSFRRKQLVAGDTV